MFKRLSWRVLATLLLLAAPFTALTTPPAAAQDITPAQVQRGLAGLDAIVADAMERTGVPSVAVVVVYRDEVVYLSGFGVRDVRTGAPVTPDTVFQLASVSKPVASTVIAALESDGVVDWDDRIVEHDPGFRLQDAWVSQHVTLRDMFAHRSGLPGHAGDLLEDIGYDREEVLHRLRYQNLTGRFRQTYAYTNFGLTEAGVAAANAAGLTWEDLSEERLYNRLGMTSTSSRYSDFLRATNRASGHVRTDAGWVVGEQRQPQAQSPAGGVSSTVRDLAQWLRLHLGEGAVDGRQIISAEALGATYVPQIVSRQPDNPRAGHPGFYALGWNVGYDPGGRVRLGHSGAFALGAGTAVTLLPAENLGIAVLTNGAPIGVPEAITAEFLDLVDYGEPRQDWLAFMMRIFAVLDEAPYGTDVDYTQPPAGATDSRDLSAYTGRYHSDYYGPITVAAGDNGLVLYLGPQQTPYALWHWSGDIFAYQPTGENAYGPSGVTFTFGAGSTASGVVVENLNIHGEGVFQRVALRK